LERIEFNFERPETSAWPIVVRREVQQRGFVVGADSGLDDPASLITCALEHRSLSSCSS